MNGRKKLRTIKTFLNLMRYHSLYTVINREFGSACNADISFVYGEYWKEYYATQYLERDTSFHVIGYPELEGQQKSVGGLFENDLPTICYLAQTSVEDGIVSSSDLNSFLDLMLKQLGRINLVLKLHPRSDVHLYQKLIEITDNVRVWEDPSFPDADCYIGHESTVVARAIYNTNKTLVYRLTKNRKSPFEKYTEYVCVESNRFVQVLEEKLSSPKNTRVSKELQSYVYKNPSGSIKETANIICKTIQGMESKK